MLVIAIALSLHFLLALTVSLFQDGFVNVSVLMQYMISYAGAIISLGLISLLSILIYLLVGSVGLTMMLVYALMAVFFVAGLYVPQLRTISITEIIGSYEEILSGFKGSLLLSSLSYYIIFMITGSFIFMKKEERLCQYD